MDCQSKLVKVVPTFYDEALLVSFSKEILKLCFLSCLNAKFPSL